ncbi:MAG: DUF5667 domain-containing protein [Chloroflexi bacterium]|nr:DUF5667 domain-containing protein [Chloroflexota bacterium]
MEKVTPELLDNCLAELAAGRTTLRECLAANPGAAEELHDLLAVARAIEPPAAVAPDPTFRIRGRAALLETIAAGDSRLGASGRQSFWGSLFGGWKQSPRLAAGGMGLRPALIAALVVLLLAASGSGVIYASQDALPDDPLYQIKTSVEGLQLSLAPDDEAKAQAHLELAARRVDEIQRATQIGRPAAVSAAAEAFVQELDQIDDHVAQAAMAGKDVSGIVVQLADNLALQQTELASAQEQAPEPAVAALKKANRAAERGLILISASAYSDPKHLKRAGDADDRTPTATATAGTPTATVTAGTPTSTATAVASGTPTVTTTVTILVSGTLPLSLTQTISDVEALANDPEVRGNSENGLLAKLEAIQKAIQRGRADTAANILNAFLNELNAFQRSGHISADSYARLYADYSALVTALGQSPQPQVTLKARGRDDEEETQGHDLPPNGSERLGRPDDEGGPKKEKDAPGHRDRGDDAPAGGGTGTVGPGVNVPTPPAEEPKDTEGRGTPGRGQDDDTPKVKDRGDQRGNGEAGPRGDTGQGPPGRSEESKEGQGRGRH